MNSLLRRTFLAHSNTKVFRSAKSGTSGSVFETTRFIRTSVILNEDVDSNPKPLQNDVMQEIYVGPLSRQVRSVKVFSLSTSIIGLGMQPIVVQQIGTGHPGLLIAAASVVGFFTFVTPFLLHYVTKSYVIRLVYDPTTDTYTSTTIRFLLMRKHLSFKADDVQIPDVPGPFTTFKVNDTPLFVDPSSFSHSDHYGKLMGYDKPIDLRITDVNTESTTSDKSSQS